MAVAVVETANRESKTSVIDRVVDAARSAADLSHEARLLKTVAQDTIEDGIYAAKRTVKTVKRQFDDLGDIKDDAIHRVKQQPLLAVGGAFAVGVAAGALCGWIASRWCAADVTSE